MIESPKRIERAFFDLMLGIVNGHPLAAADRTEPWQHSQGQKKVGAQLENDLYTELPVLLLLL